MVRWVVGSILHGVDPLSYFSFQPVLHDWCNKGCGMYYPVCGMMHIKEPLLLIGKSSLCGGSGFPLSLSEWSFTICVTPYDRKYFLPSFHTCLSASIFQGNKTLWLPNLVCLRALPINPIDSLTMWSKSYKNAYFLAFFKCFVLQNHKAASWARRYLLNRSILRERGQYCVN